MEKLHVGGIITVQFLDDLDPLFEDNTPAKYNPADNFIYVKESVLEELENGEYRANFTLAHEFFHFLQCKIFDFPFCDADYCPNYKNAEWQADEFAGQLLIPSMLVYSDDYDIAHIAETFKVSPICAATRRVKALNRLKRNTIIGVTNEFSNN